MEPWDGPAAIAFTDGRSIGATLDRNGLRPARYLLTNDDLIILASETGVLPVKPENVKLKGRLQPGKMLLVDTVEGRIVSDKELKRSLYSRNPYQMWLKENQITLDSLADPPREYGSDQATLLKRQRAFGYTDEDIRIVLGPMVEQGEEPIGSMGTDTPLACLSDKPQPLFHYFKQLFAQVTNPPIDPIREEMVMSLTSYIGTERNILQESALHCHTLKLPQPILRNRDLEKLRRVSQGDFLATTLPMLFAVEEGAKGLERALTQLSRRASLAIQSGYTLLILSDRGVDEDYAPIPSLLALAAVHNHLVREETRTQVALIIESGDAREVMHFALLIGYGASAVNPYLAIETVETLGESAGVAPDKALANYIKSINKGLLKTFSKMGISTPVSYTHLDVYKRQLIMRPGFRNQHGHGVRNSAARHDQQLQCVVERRRIAAARLDDGEQLLDVVPEQRRRQHRLPRAHPIHVPAQSVDLAVMRDVPAVSYTHLDVYKRQRYNSTSACLNRASPVSSTPCISRTAASPARPAATRAAAI